MLVNRINMPEVIMSIIDHVWPFPSVGIGAYNLWATPEAMRLNTQRTMEETRMRSPMVPSQREARVAGGTESWKVMK